MKKKDAGPVFDAPCPRLFSISPGPAFLDEIAELAIEHAGDDPAALADMEIFLPTRRAIRALGDSFLRLAKGRASLLPRMRALGDVDDEDIFSFKGLSGDETSLAPAVSALERRMVLAKLAAAKERAFSDRDRWAGALAAADELAALLDSFYTEEISPDALKTIVPERLADHWARSLAFLEIVTKAWPEYLSSIGRLDPADRRVKLIGRMAEHYKATKPQHPIIIAGTTGSTPAVSRLIEVIAHLPCGCVVLPGVDLGMSHEHWTKIDDAHPQFGLRQLLETDLGVDRSAVCPLAKTADASAPHAEIVSVALRPAAASDSWRDWIAEARKQKTDLPTRLGGLTLIEAEDEEREADAIALTIREALLSPEQTIYLVTPDRDLSRRVSLKLRRWNISVDDSAGVPFGNSRCGAFLRLVAHWLGDLADPVRFAALVRHPLFGGGLAVNERGRAADDIDLDLRGLAPPDVGALAARLSPVAGGKISSLIENVHVELAPATSFAEFYAAHLRVAEMFAETDEEAGGARLWRGEDGAVGAERLSEAGARVGSLIETWDRSEYPAIFDQLISDISVRRRAPAHPRVAILGPLEARLQAADIVILGGLNEGVWPRDAAIDGFLSRGMRRDIGFPSPERRVGLAAHDFAQMSASSRAVLTRAKKTGGKPATASRWVVRLKNILKGADALEHVDDSAKYAALVSMIDTTPAAVISAPAPRPPVDARPTTFFVTNIERLLRDPYAIYARSILGLRKLDELAEPMDARHVGNLFHKIFEEYAGGAAPADPGVGKALLRSLFAKHAPEFGFNAVHDPFWRDRVEQAIDWFAAWDADRRREGHPAVIEESGAWSFTLDGCDYALAAKVDRIDVLNDRAAAIFDYKTGEPPPTNKQQAKFSPQLALTALIVKAGGFETLGPARVDAFEYVRVLNRKGTNKDSVRVAGADAQKLMAETRENLSALLRFYADREAPYLSQPRPQFTNDFGEFDQLARRKERRAAGGDE